MPNTEILFGAQKGLFQGPNKKNGQLMPQRLKLPDGFQGRVFKGKIWGPGYVTFFLLV